MGVLSRNLLSSFSLFFKQKMQKRTDTKYFSIDVQRKKIPTFTFSIFYFCHFPAYFFCFSFFLQPCLSLAAQTFTVYSLQKNHITGKYIKVYLKNESFSFLQIQQ